LNIDLHESSSELFRLPRSRCLARTKAHDHVLPARRLTWPKRDVLDDAVALVENSENRDALSHGRDTALPCGRRRRFDRAELARALLPAATTARRQRERDHQCCRKLSHAYSGIQGS
jgi:hypothetical protein